MWRPQDNLRAQIVRILAARPHADMPSIAATLKALGSRYSAQGIYRQLRLLQAEGAVVKERQNYGLALPWVLNIVGLADVMFDTHVQGVSLETLLPADAKKTTWMFHNLERLNAFWVHSLFMLLQLSSTRVMHQWLPHPWWLFIWTEGNLQFQKGLIVGGFQVLNIMGHDNELDLEFERRTVISQQNCRFFYAKSEFQGNDREYYSLCDDRLVVASLDQHVVRDLDHCFSDTPSWDKLDFASAIEILRRPAKHKLSIEVGTTRVRKIQKIFSEYFPPT